MFEAIPTYGLYYYYQLQVVALPLLGVRAEASIKELAAQVKLTQTYANNASFPIEAKYSFPIPARASVCGFVLIKQDGTRVVGSVLEKHKARETYNTGVAQGQQASLMEQQTPDVFHVSVGNIPAHQQVQIELVYVTELSEDEENDSIRFHLPVHIGARYGQAPQWTPSIFRSTVFFSPSANAPFLTIAVSIEAIAPISKISSPSHTVSTELGPDATLPHFKELPFSNYARVSLSSDSALDKDFVLTIKSAGLDAPRCVAELHPTSDTVALGLTLVPRFKLPDVSRQEFVFLVDRSGSMEGKRLAAARRALVVMLRAVPHHESLFQIMSFGSWCTALWPQGSKPYNQETLEEATRHVDAMQADYGGTEIRSALSQCFQTSKLDRPMSVLVLTDGDAWDIDGVLSEVKSAVAAAPKTAYVRVSVLGIGNSASTAMCEGIARVGNGTCMMVGEEETTFTGKIARMLKAALAPPISNISVDWGRAPSKEKAAASAQDDEDEFEIVEKPSRKKKTLNIFDELFNDPMGLASTRPPPPPAVVLSPPPAVQQAPFVIHYLFPNIRLNAYAILQGKAVPKTVTIRGSTADGAEIELPIPITFSHLQNAPGAPPAIHALAARKIIQDLEEGKHALVATLANPDDTDLLARTVKASIIRLGTTYSISSSHTSFVAVDESRPESPAVPEMPVPPPARGAYARYSPQPQALAAGPQAAATVLQALAAVPPGLGGMNPPMAMSSQAYPFSLLAPRYGGGSIHPPRMSPMLSQVNGAPPRQGNSMGRSSTSNVAARTTSSSSSLFNYAAPESSNFAARTSSSSAAYALPQQQLQSSAMSMPMGHSGTSDDLMSLSSSPWADMEVSFASAAPSLPAYDSELLLSTPFDPTICEVDNFSADEFALLDSGDDYCVSVPPPPQTKNPRIAFNPPEPDFGGAFGGPWAAGTLQQATNISAPDSLEALARLQSFDGSFTLGVLSVIALRTDLQTVRDALPAAAPDQVVATVLAMSFLAAKLAAEHEAWAGLHEKARQYIAVALRDMGAAESVTADMLQARVGAMLA